MVSKNQNSPTLNWRFFYAFPTHAQEQQDATMGFHNNNRPRGTKRQQCKTAIEYRYTRVRRQVDPATDWGGGGGVELRHWRCSEHLPHCITSSYHHLAYQCRSLASRTCCCSAATVDCEQCVCNISVSGVGSFIAARLSKTGIIRNFLK